MIRNKVSECFEDKNVNLEEKLIDLSLIIENSTEDKILIELGGFVLIQELHLKFISNKTGKN